MCFKLHYSEQNITHLGKLEGVMHFPPLHATADQAPGSQKTEQLQKNPAANSKGERQAFHVNFQQDLEVLRNQNQNLK